MAFSEYFPFDIRFDQLDVIVFVKTVVPDVSGFIWILDIYSMVQKIVDVSY